jgi:hypothetical protein
MRNIFFFSSLQDGQQDQDQDQQELEMMPSLVVNPPTTRIARRENDHQHDGNKRLMLRLCVFYGCVALAFASHPIFEWTTWKMNYRQVIGTVVERNACLTKHTYSFGTEIMVEYEIILGETSKTFTFESGCIMNDDEDRPSPMLPPLGDPMKLYYLPSDPGFNATNKTWMRSPTRRGPPVFLVIAIISCSFSLLLWLCYTRDIWRSGTHLAFVNFAILCSACFVLSLLGFILSEA